MSEQPAEISVGCADGGLYVRVLGQATLRTCPTVERVVADYAATHEGDLSVTVDLSGCDWVDSTFAGWLIGLRKRLQDRTGRLVLANCGEVCRTALSKMHLDTLFEFGTCEAPPNARTIACISQARPTPDDLRLMLEAHESLAELDEDNQRVFGPIVAALRKQVEQGG